LQGAHYLARVTYRRAAAWLRDRAQTGFSIEPPHMTQWSCAVSRMRTIVECSPQLGQCEESWKRWKQ
jgi:hypothetical protein